MKTDRNAARLVIDPTAKSKAYEESNPFSKTMSEVQKEIANGQIQTPEETYHLFVSNQRAPRSLKYSIIDFLKGTF